MTTKQHRAPVKDDQSTSASSPDVDIPCGPSQDALNRQASIGAKRESEFKPTGYLNEVVFQIVGQDTANGMTESTLFTLEKPVPVQAIGDGLYHVCGSRIPVGDGTSWEFDPVIREGAVFFTLSLKPSQVSKDPPKK
jgi:hypothetical protein